MTSTNTPILPNLIEGAMHRLVEHKLKLRRQMSGDETLFEVHFCEQDLLDFEAAGGSIPRKDESEEIDNIQGVSIKMHGRVAPGQAWIMYDGEIIETVEHPGAR